MTSYGWFVVRLSKFYDNANLSQADIVRSVGVKQQVLARFEKGERKPTIGFLVALAETYNLSLDYLFGFSDEMYLQNRRRLSTKEIGSNILKKRQELGVYQHIFANAIGIERHTLSLIERGKAKLKVSTAVNICEQYGMSFDDLFFTSVTC